MKYITFTQRPSVRGMPPKKIGVMFTEDLIHADVAKALKPLGGKTKLKVDSAGFVDVDIRQTRGRSDSLDIGIQIGDCDILSEGRPVIPPEALVCTICGKPDNRPHSPWNTLHDCHFDCFLGNPSPPDEKPITEGMDLSRLQAMARQALDTRRAQRAPAQAPTLAHAFTHTARLPAVVPIGAELPRHVTRALVARCLTLCRSVWDWEASSRMFLTVHWHAKQGMRKHQELSQAYLFHAYQVVALSDWDDNSEKIEALNLINAVQTIDPRNELRGQVYTVNTQHGTVTTHSLSEAKSIANSRADK